MSRSASQCVFSTSCHFDKFPVKGLSDSWTNVVPKNKRRVANDRFRTRIRSLMTNPSFKRGQLVPLGGATFPRQ